MKFGRLYLGSYPIIESPGLWPIRFNPFHFDEPCCGEARSFAVELVGPQGSGRGYEIEWTIGPAKFSPENPDISEQETNADIDRLRERMLRGRQPDLNFSQQRKEGQ
jgi:hypothetical protein